MVLRLPTISIVELKSDRRLMFTHVTRVYRGKLYSLGKLRFGKCFSPLSSRGALNVAPGLASGQINIPCSAGYRLHPLRMQPRFRYVTRYRNHPGNRNSTLSSIRTLRKRHGIQENGMDYREAYRGTKLKLLRRSRELNSAFLSFEVVFAIRRHRSEFRFVSHNTRQLFERCKKTSNRGRRSWVNEFRRS